MRPCLYRYGSAQKGLFYTYRYSRGGVKPYPLTLFLKCVGRGELGPMRSVASMVPSSTQRKKSFQRLRAHFPGWPLVNGNGGGLTQWTLTKWASQRKRHSEP